MWLVERREVLGSMPAEELLAEVLPVEGWLVGEWQEVVKMEGERPGVEWPGRGCRWWRGRRRRTDRWGCGSRWWRLSRRRRRLKRRRRGLSGRRRGLEGRWGGLGSGGGGRRRRGGWGGGWSLASNAGNYGAYQGNEENQMLLHVLNLYGEPAEVVAV
ncbi:hypothetical protein VIGAN_10248600 [Vigna angularis var. angularis]|uniref:Uncharacterized protein n=1 Tax=Vigna angularis var. angularis TaxID=157739 RepID=A0A0S3T7C8_PHAAN|nr:hypothetical protein VIGAN_10248600 [Vigna angularis var. angularis]